jgi:hypothetical protein
MGSERFTRAAYETYATTTSLRSSSREEVFTSRNIPQALDPKKILLRESCDSALNPQSTPIIFGLDVTGSMGFIPEYVAKEGLPDVVERIYEELPVTDPHVMFMGIGDVYDDQAPLQVSQFEAGAVTLIEQLRTLWLEGHGGGNNTESYDLPWYFAAHKTAIDSFDKRGEKGFIFTFGDEMPPHKDGLSARDLKRTFGEGQHIAAGTTKQLLEEVQKRYQVFHIIAEEGSYCRGYRLPSVQQAWVDLLGPNVIMMKNHKDLAEIIVATLKIAKGADIKTILKESEIKENLKHAFSNAV